MITLSSKELKPILLSICDDNIDYTKRLTTFNFLTKCIENEENFKTIHRLIAEHNPYSESVDAIDLSGTGGSGLNLLNISTASSFVLASMGIPVVKNGGSSITSTSGSSDVLKELGIVPNKSLTHAKWSLYKNNLCFISLSDYNPIIRSLSPFRKSLKKKTKFNTMCPLLNPLKPKRHLMGVTSPEEISLVSSVNDRFKPFMSNYMGINVDEAIPGSKTTIRECPYEFRRNYTTSLESIKGGTPLYNACRIMDLLNGKKDDFYHCVMLTSAIASVSYNYVILFESDIEEHYKSAEEAIDSGKALKLYNTIKEESYV